MSRVRGAVLAFHCESHCLNTNSYRVWKSHMQEAQHQNGDIFIIARMVLSYQPSLNEVQP